MKPSNSTTSGERFRSIVYPSGPIIGSTSRVTPRFLVSNAVGVEGVTTPWLTKVPGGGPTVSPVPLTVLGGGGSGALNSVGYGNSRATRTIALRPLLVVTFGADIRSTPFFWLKARMTTCHCGFVNMPARPKMPGAVPMTVVPSNASMLFAVIAALGPKPKPDRKPPVTGF